MLRKHLCIVTRGDDLATQVLELCAGQIRQAEKHLWACCRSVCWEYGFELLHAAWKR